MTNLFGWNMTKGQNVGNVDGAVFLTRTLSDEQNAALDSFQNSNEDFVKKSKLPLPLRIVQGICLFGWWIILIGILKADVSFAEGYRNAPGLYWALPICFVLWLVLFMLGKYCQKQLAQDDALKEHFENAESLTQMARNALGIPEDAQNIDVLAERYVLKDGEIKHKDFNMTNFLNLDLFIFYEDGNLCLADLRQRLDIPLRSLHTMRLEKKKKSFPEWHKSEPSNAPKYKPFKIAVNQYGHVFSRYYRVDISDVKGEFYLLIPEYDGDVFTEVTHIHPETREIND